MAMTYGAHEAPFGGRKHSGLGQVNGAVGLRGFCFAQPILVDRFGGRQAASHYPYSVSRDAGMQRLMRLLWGTPLGRWLS
jgi:succinate-semialdehyde dehydrogenase/glutarate-semialdehyde dehydrogenase